MRSVGEPDRRRLVRLVGPRPVPPRAKVDALTSRALLGVAHAIGSIGDDFLDGGPGRDVLGGGRGGTTCSLRDAEADVADCGGDGDVAYADVAPGRRVRLRDASRY